MCLHQLCFVASQKFAFFPTNGLETLKGPVVPHLKFRSSDPRATGRTTWESVRPPEQTSATSPQPSDHLKGSAVGRSQKLVSWLVGWSKVSLRPDSECAWVCEQATDVAETVQCRTRHQINKQIIWLTITCVSFLSIIFRMISLKSFYQSQILRSIAGLQLYQPNSHGAQIQMPSKGCF